MTHEHLRLHLLDRVKRNTDDDDDRGAAQSHIGEVRGDRTDDQRYQSDDAEEYGTDEGNLAERLGDEVAGRLAGTEARDEAAVLLQVVGDLDRVELDGCIEVCKCEDQQCVQ